MVLEKGDTEKTAVNYFCKTFINEKDQKRRYRITRSKSWSTTLRYVHTTRPRAVRSSREIQLILHVCTCHCDLAEKLPWSGLHIYFPSPFPFNEKVNKTRGDRDRAHEAINATRARVASRWIDFSLVSHRFFARTKYLCSPRCVSTKRGQSMRSRNVIIPARVRACARAHRGSLINNGPVHFATAKF